jgi:hypothetical protein
MMGGVEEDQARLGRIDAWATLFIQMLFSQSSPEANFFDPANSVVAVERAYTAARAMEEQREKSRKVTPES